MAAKNAALLARWDVGSGVNSVAVSYSGAWAASGSRDGHIRVWDVHTGALVLGPLRGHTNLVWSVVWSNDDTLIISGSFDRTIRVWNARTGAPVGNPLRGHTGTIYSVAISPDRTRLASGSSDNTIRIWDTYTGALLGKPLKGHDGQVFSVAFSPNGARIVSGSYDNTIRIWDALTGASIGGPLGGHSNTVCSVAFSPNSFHIVSGSNDFTIRKWDALTDNTISWLLGQHNSSIQCVAVSPDNTRIASGSYDNTVCIWDAHTGALIGEPLKEHTRVVWSVAFSPDSNQIISGSGDGTICVWEAPRYMPPFDMVTSKMSAQEMFDCLVKHGCTDLTSATDFGRSSSAVVASGGFGEVRRMVMHDGTIVATKTLRLHILLKDDDKAVKRAVREVYIWSRLCHVNIQKLLGIIVFQGGLGMVSPWMEQGNLQQYILAHPDVKRHPLCVQVASGISYLHSIEMVHGDLKANNVLVSDDGTLKINDFDHAMLSETTLRFSATTRLGGGTLRWMAPELLQPEEADEGDTEEEGTDEEETDEKGVDEEEEKATQTPASRSKEADIYALGMTMLEILTGNVPYAEYRSEMGVYRAIHTQKPPKRPKRLPLSNKMWDLLLNCWNHEPSARPSTASVLVSLNSLVD